jgi:ankyrin repeat protein
MLLGATCLHVAVAAGQEESVRILIARGADLNARTLVGDTPLHYASRMGYETIVR